MIAARLRARFLFGAVIGVLAAGLLGWAGSAQNAHAETMLVTAPWTRVRAEPTEKARVLNIVYGNDSFTVLEQRPGWARVRLRDQTQGWVSATDIVLVPDDGTGAVRKAPSFATAELGPTPLPPIPSGPTVPIVGGSALDTAEALQRLGYRDDARRRLVNMVLQPSNPQQSYRATRDLLHYYPLGKLPAFEQANDQAKEQAGQLASALLLVEGENLTREKRFRDAVALYDLMLRKNEKDGRAYLALLDTLNTYMIDAAKASGLEELNFAVSTLRRRFPDQPLPAAAQARLGK